MRDSSTSRVPVAALIPEFAPNGKDAITVEQVMLHTSGFPRAAVRVRSTGTTATGGSHGSRAGAATGSRARAYEYHPTTRRTGCSRRLIERCTGGDFRTFVRERILDPLGLTGARGRCRARSAGRHQRSRAHRRTRDPGRVGGRDRRAVAAADRGDARRVDDVQPARGPRGRRSRRRRSLDRGRPRALLPGAARRSGRDLEARSARPT